MRHWLGIFVVCSSLLGACGAGDAAREDSRGDAAPAIVGNVLTVRGAWARTADSGAATAVYFTLANDGPATDTLTGVASDEAETAEMHISTQHDGTMHMTPVTQLPVPGMDSVSFRPLGAHVMLTGVRRPLAEGDSVTATLRFVSGATVSLTAGVRAP